MKNSKLRKVMATAVAVMASFSLVVPSAAFADDGSTGGGTGGGGSSGGSQRGVQWASIAYKTPGKAYDSFIKKSGYRKSTTDGEIKKRVGDIKICKNSNVIWYIKSGKYWTFNYDGATHSKRWNGSGTIESPKTKYGSRGPTDAEIRAFKVWDKKENGNKINKKPGYTIICSGAFAKPTKTWETVKKSTAKNEGNKYEVTKPYSWTTEVKAQPIKVDAKDASKNTKTDPIGEENLNDQKSKNVKTNYGKLWDSLNTKKGQGMKPSEVKKKVKEALAKDAKLKHSTVNLNAKNKAGMAEGGVLNIYERTRPATIKAVETVTTVTTTTCVYTQEWDSEKGKYKPPKKKCTSKKDKTSKNTVTKKTATAQNTGFWQMLAVHCNKLELEALLKADKSIKLVDTGDSTKGIAAVVYSKKYKQQPKTLDFGDSTNTNKAKKATGFLGFYDKECPFDCTPSSKASDGASGSNGATKNVGTTENVVSGGKYGATSDNHTNNFFEFFRDNEAKNVKVDVWYPKSTGVVKYDKSAPKTTTIVRDKNGTPGVSGDGGKFTMKTKSGKELFKGEDKVKTQKNNWNKNVDDKFTNSNATILDGLQREFSVKATWASEDNKPQIINVKWEYGADVSTRFFGKDVGYGVKGVQNTGETVKATANIEGKCYSNFGTTNQFDTTEVFNKNTGTNTTNGLDNKILEKDSTNHPKEKNTNLVFNFVRSTTE